jgi:hypothetical protein
MEVGQAKDPEKLWPPVLGHASGCEHSALRQLASNENAHIPDSSN